MSISTKKFISNIQGQSTNPEGPSYVSHLAEGLVQGLKECHCSWDMQVWCTEKAAPWKPCLLHFYPAVCVQGSYKQDTKQTNKKYLEIIN